MVLETDHRNMQGQKNLILAAGQASRWNGPGIKQLLPIGDKPLIVHTASRLPSPCIIGHRMEFNGLGFDFFEPGDSTGTCRTVLSTTPLWHGCDRVNILLGDVWYTDAALDSVLGCQAPIMWFGDGHDVFAVSFGDQKKAIELFETASRLGANECRLWEAYRALCGLDEWPMTSGGPYYTMIMDGTTDFDTIDKYQAWIAKTTTP